MTTAIASAETSSPAPAIVVPTRARRRTAYQIPSPATTSPTSSFVVIASDREHGEEEQAVLVQVPEREQQQWTGEGNRVELVQRQPLGRRVEQVDECEREPGAVAGEMLAREPEHRKRSESDCDRLDDEQHLRARPDPPERRENGEDRVEVRGQARDLHSVAARHLQEVAVRGVPDRLHHVPQVVAAGRIGAVTEDRQRGEAGGIRGHRCPDQRLGSHRSDAISSRQRAPSTSSLACSR